MQNLTTTLLTEIQREWKITLPSGSAKFNWVDTKNIGEASARVLLDFEQYQNKSFEITGSENRNFAQVTEMMSTVLGHTIKYRSMNPISFYLKKRKEGMASDYAMVMTLLHFLPRLQKDPQISNDFEALTGDSPNTLMQFFEREKSHFEAG
jgi:hypothetical protein